MTDLYCRLFDKIGVMQSKKHRVVEVLGKPNLKKEITKILFDKGYILNFKPEDGSYDQDRLRHKLERVSTPGLWAHWLQRNAESIEWFRVLLFFTSKGV